MPQGRVLCLLAFFLFLSIGFVHAKYFTATELVPESTKTNVVFGSENIYFDLYEGGSPLQSAEVLVQYSSDNGTNPNTFYVFIRRWSPLVGATSEKDIDSLIEECEQAASMPLSYNQYECYYALVEPDVVVSPANLTLNFPRFGRYFVLIQNTFPNGTEYIMASNVTIGLQYHNCPNPAHVGQGCASSVQTFTNPIEVTVAADTWEYFLHSVDPGVPAINIDFLSSLDHITSPNASVAFRIGNTPIYGDYDVGFYNFKQNDSYKWINPLTGNLYIGIYGGDSGVTTSFNVSTEVCALPTNGAYCEAPLLQNVLCVDESVDECPFVDNKVVIGSNYELKIDSMEWEYVHFQLGASGYAVNLITRLKEYTDDSALTIVVNVGGIPNNNDENGFETFSLKDVFPFIRGLRSDDLESDIEIPYPTRMAGYYYVGFHNSGKDDVKIDFVVEYTNCPNNCSGNGVCNLQTFTCACDTNEFNPIDCSSPQTPSTATSSSKTPSTATPTTADSNGSDVRSTIHDTISNLSSDEGHGGDTASAVVITISILFPLIVLFSMLVAITILFFLRKRTDYERVE